MKLLEAWSLTCLGSRLEKRLWMELLAEANQIWLGLEYQTVEDLQTSVERTAEPQIEEGQLITVIKGCVWESHVKIDQSDEFGNMSKEECSPKRRRMYHIIIGTAQVRTKCRLQTENLNFFFVWYVNLTDCHAIAFPPLSFTIICSIVEYSFCIILRFIFVAKLKWDTGSIKAEILAVP